MRILFRTCQIMRPGTSPAILRRPQPRPGKLRVWRGVSRGMIHSAVCLVLMGWLGSVRAADLDPKAITIQLPNQIKWVESPDGSATAVVRGDPNQPGEYILLVKWHAHHMSRPHYHPNDRFVTVISGTWWVGTGTKFDPESTVPIPPGSFVRHTGKQVHYDGAKDQEVMLQIVGQGPATMIPAGK